VLVFRTPQPNVLCVLVSSGGYKSTRGALMKLREPVVLSHIHRWRIYDPTADRKSIYDPIAPVQTYPDTWTYRECECGVKMRCLSWVLSAYPTDFRAFADEEWELL
jgi:hypothetical protein